MDPLWESSTEAEIDGGQKIASDPSRWDSLGRIYAAPGHQSEPPGTGQGTVQQRVEKPQVEERLFQAGEVTVTNKEPKQGESFEITFAVKGGEAPYIYSITFPSNTIQSIKDKKSQAKEIKEKLNVPETLPANTKITPQIEVTDNNKKSINFEKKIPDIVVKEKAKLGP